jgi:hypothetical protein
MYMYMYEVLNGKMYAIIKGFRSLQALDSSATLSLITWIQCISNVQKL